MGVLQGCSRLPSKRSVYTRIRIVPLQKREIEAVGMFAVPVHRGQSTRRFPALQLGKRSLSQTSESAFKIVAYAQSNNPEFMPCASAPSNNPESLLQLNLAPFQKQQRSNSHLRADVHALFTQLESIMQILHTHTQLNVNMHPTMSHIGA